MSRLRPTLRSGAATTPTLYDGTAYYAIYGTVCGQPGLVHGLLHDGHGAHCAIGSYFDANPLTALPTALIDEVAAVNDSVPHATPRQRKLHVQRWLRWRLAQLGVPGFRTKAPPRSGS